MAPKNRTMKLANDNKTASPSGIDELPLSSAEMEAYATIAKVKEELGSEEGRVFIRRRDDKGQMAALGSFPASDFTIDQVIRDFGGGRYDATFWKGPENLGSVQFNVDESIPRRLPKSFLVESDAPSTPTPASPGYPVPPWGVMSPEIVALKEVLSKQAELVNQLIVQMATREQAPREQISIQDIIALMNARGTPTGAEQLIAAIKDGVELGRSAGEGGGGDKGYWPVLERLAGPVARTLESALERDRGAVRGALPAPAGAPGRPAAPPSSGVPAMPPGAPTWLVHLAPHVPALIAYARANKDPALYAAVILDNIDPGAQLEIAEAAKDPQFIEKTVAVLPAPLKAYSVWCQQVLDEMRKILLAPVEDDTGGDGGDGMGGDGGMG